MDVSLDTCRRRLSSVRFTWRREERLSELLTQRSEVRAEVAEMLQREKSDEMQQVSVFEPNKDEAAEMSKSQKHQTVLKNIQTQKSEVVMDQQI